MNKYLMLLVTVFIFGNTCSQESHVKSKKRSRWCQRNDCSPKQRLGIEFGYYAYPPSYDRVPYPFYYPYWGTGYYYPVYPNYRSIGVDYGFAWGSPIW